MYILCRRFWFRVFFASIYVGNICNAVMLHLTEGYMLKMLMAYDFIEFMSVLISCKDQNQNVC